MVKRKINIPINLDNLLNELLQLLQKTIYLVSIGLQSKDKIEPDLLHLPTRNFTVTFDGGLKWDADKVQKQYYNWVLTNGFRDIIEGVNTFLESTHKVLSYWEIVRRQKDGAKLTGTDWNDNIITGGKKFHRLGLPVKLDHLKEQHQIEVETKLIEQLISANTARSCLVHRRGVVTQEDITNKNTLKVKWTKITLILKNEDGEQELVFGEQVKKKSSLSIRNKEAFKAFDVGKQISFTAEEFENIAWSQFQFGNDVVQKVKDRGVKTGFLKT